MEKVLGHNCFSGFSFSVASKIIKKLLLTILLYSTIGEEWTGEASLPYWVVDGWSVKEASLGLDFPNWVKLILNWPASWLAPLTCTSLPPLDMIYIKIWTAANFQLRLTVQPISIQMWAACNDWRVDRRISKKLQTLQIWFHSLLLTPTSCASEDRKQNEIFELSHK